MDPNKPASVVGYARVSILQQEERLRAYCAAKGWRLLNIYVDGGWSGGSLNRPALGELLEAVERGGIDGVFVCNLERLSRSQKDTLYLIEDRLLAHGTDFISINENFDTSTPFGRAMIGMLSVFAQLERNQSASPWAGSAGPRRGISTAAEAPPQATTMWTACCGSTNMRPSRCGRPTACS